MLLQKEDFLKEVSNKTFLYASSHDIEGEKIEFRYNVEAEKKVLFHVVKDEKSLYSGTSLDRAISVFNSTTKK